MAASSDFVVGEEVECKDRSDPSWLLGTVSSAVPLSVVPQGWERPCCWDLVRHPVEASRGDDDDQARIPTNHSIDKPVDEAWIPTNHSIDERADEARIPTNHSIDEPVDEARIPTNHSNDDPVDEARDEQAQEQSCSICLCDFEGGAPVPLADSTSSGVAADGTVRLPCPGGHFYHRNCIVQWLRTHRTCPLCRTDVSAGAVSAGAGEYYDSNVFDESGQFRRSLANDLLLADLINLSIWIGWDCCWAGMCSCDCCSVLAGCFQAGFQDIGAMCTGMCNGDCLTAIGGGCAACLEKIREAIFGKPAKSHGSQQQDPTNLVSSHRSGQHDHGLVHRSGRAHAHGHAGGHVVCHSHHAAAGLAKGSMHTAAVAASAVPLHSAVIACGCAAAAAAALVAVRSAEAAHREA